MKCACSAQLAAVIIIVLSGCSVPSSEGGTEMNSVPEDNSFPSAAVVANLAITASLHSSLSALLMCLPLLADLCLTCG